MRALVAVPKAEVEKAEGKKVAISKPKSKEIGATGMEARQKRGSGLKWLLIVHVLLIAYPASFPLVRSLTNFGRIPRALIYPYWPLFYIDQHLGFPKPVAEAWNWYINHPIWVPGTDLREGLHAVNPLW